MKKTSDRVEAARKLVIPAAEDFVHAAADRVGPLAQSAADRVGPLAEAAAEALGAAADKVSPYAHQAADRLAPLAHTAADRVGPLAGQARDRVSPYATQAAAAVSPYAQQAAAVVSPYAATAVHAVSPYAHSAADRLGPLADTAKQRGSQAAHDAFDRLGPVLDDALDRVGPAVESAREKVSGELLPKLTGAISAAAAAPVVTEAVNRGHATLAAARGDLVLPPEKKKGSWLKRLAVVAGLAGLTYVLARRILGSKDSDWQAARPTTPYTPPTPATATEPAETPADVPTAESDDAGDDPQSGSSAHSDYLDANGAAEPKQPAEGGDLEADTSLAAEAVEEPVVDIEEPASDIEEPVSEGEPVAGSDTVFAEPPVDSDPTVVVEPDDTVVIEAVANAEPTAEAVASRFSGEGAYVGTEPPEGFFIKGNERSMKYHLPESAGYVRTIAEVWFDSEEAAQAAGFIRAQR